MLYQISKQSIMSSTRGGAMRRDERKSHRRRNGGADMVFRMRGFAMHDVHREVYLCSWRGSL